MNGHVTFASTRLIHIAFIAEVVNAGPVTTSVWPMYVGSDGETMRQVWIKVFDEMGFICD